MSSALNSYLSQYAALNAEITSSISKFRRPSSISDEEAREESARIEKGFEETDELFEQMELEIRELGRQSEQEKCTNQLMSFKAERKRLRDEYQACKNCLRKTDRDNLLGTFGGSNDVSPDKPPESTSHFQRLLGNSETVERTGRKLDQGHQLLAESEQVGVDILNDLSLQREVLTRSRNRLRDTDDDLGTSSRILSGMITRIQQSKVMLVLIAVIILFMLIVIIYLSFKG